MKGGRTSHITPLTPHPPSFLEYLNSQRRKRNNDPPSYDFILDAKDDPLLKDVTSLEKLLSYLRYYRAEKPVIDAGIKVWKQYKTYISK